MAEPESASQFAALPRWLARPVEAVIGDLSLPAAIQLVASYHPDPDTPHGGLLAFNDHSGRAFGFGVSANADDQKLRVLIAEGLQSNLPELPELWGEAIPRCPKHTHPAIPRLMDGIAYWVCPNAHDALSRIGHYST